MNWIPLISVSLITIGGFMATTYEVTAKRIGLPIGFYFQKNGIMTIIGGFITFGAAILSAFINPWWTIFIVFLVGWFFSQLIISACKSLSQIISLILIVIGITSLSIALLQ